MSCNRIVHLENRVSPIRASSTGFGRKTFWNQVSCQLCNYHDRWTRFQEDCYCKGSVMAFVYNKFKKRININKLKIIDLPVKIFFCAINRLYLFAFIDYYDYMHARSVTNQFSIFLRLIFPTKIKLLFHRLYTYY